MNTFKNRHGFTLIELLITLSILAILTAAALPSLSQMVTKNQSDAIINEIHSFFRLGRNSAINENQIVVACPTEDGENCARDWKQEWILFTDTNRNYSVDDDETLLKKLDLDLENFDIIVKPARRGNFRWQPLGITHGAPGSIIICKPGYEQANRKITVSMLGRMRLSHDSDSDGVHEDIRGRDISCG